MAGAAREAAHQADRQAAGAAQLAAAMRNVNERYSKGGLLPPGLGYARNASPYAELVRRTLHPDERDPPVAYGSVTGYRWWTLPAPDWRTFPSEAEENWPHGRLHGMQEDWQPGVNIAACRPLYDPGSSRHDPVLVPYRGCSCGFWALWQPPLHPAVSKAGSVQVFGVIKAWGRFRRGPLGFRAQKARILAVHPSFTLLPYVDKSVVYGPVRADDPSVLPPGWHEVTDPGRARRGHSVRTLANGKKLLLPDDVTDEQAAIADAHAEAWMATLGVRLEDDYGMRVFETRDALLAAFPPDPVYGHVQPCRYCQGDTLAGHVPGCRNWGGYPF